MLMETRKKMRVFLRSSAISSLVKMREREMITPAVPGNTQVKGRQGGRSGGVVAHMKETARGEVLDSLSPVITPCVYLLGSIPM